MTTSDVAVRIADAGKRYVKYDDVPLLLSRAFRFRAGNKKSHLWAVRHVDLEVHKGETVGIVGRNGSGKSTTLRMLAGVTAPTEGMVAVKGRVAPLIAVGVGFHNELTGRENVYVNGSILGMNRKEIDRRFDSIVDFAEIEGFIDTPVKFYSSGMFVRLGFAVAVASEPDVLIVDEVLAVGDFAFQQKCYERMAQIQANGSSVLVVSHNVGAIRRLCSRVMVLHDGEPRYLGETEEGISVFHELLSPQYRSGAPADRPVEIGTLELFGEDGRKTQHLQGGEVALFRLPVTFTATVESAVFSFRILSDGGQTVYAESTWRQGGRRFERGERTQFEVSLPTELATGSYLVRAAVSWGEDKAERMSALPIALYVSGRAGVKGFADLKGSLVVTAAEVPEDSEREPV